MRTVFLTGAEGFTGSHVLTLLRERGYEVVAGVRNRARKLAYERQGLRALVCDVTDAINVARAIASIAPDAVLHLAGPTSTAETSEEPLAAYQAIVTGWANVLDAVRRTVPRAKVLLASAGDIYGTAGDDGKALPETTPAAPVTTFGSLKRAAESIAHTFYRDYHLNVTIARPFVAIGAHQPDRQYFGAAARRLAQWDAGSHGPQLWLPDLSCTRDLLHVNDVATAYVRLLEDGRPAETYNIASGQGWRCGDIVTRLAAAFGVRIEPTELPQDPAHPRVNALIGDSDKLRRELGWSPQFTVETALTELANSLRVQPVVTAAESVH
ncbi:MAG: NAD(P)-dependent oxidoreductase [Phycisphaerales bacterium]|nr:NAD(P)-dependent oxidoreductase [Phycisphaerales bacterium]